jgi:hypothetical protein
MASIQSTVMAAVSAIVAAAQSLWNQLVGGSIWTDMLEEMQAQTASALGNITGAFENMSLAVPETVPYSPSVTSSSPAVASTATSVPSFGTQQSITIPITITLDGQVITKTVKKMLVEESRYRSRSVGGYT